ncbi:glycosyltransferase family 2 protein [Lactobacillus amylovorus subsp. animalium]|uniref:Glycosyltransferase family 2 protein n=1 Tax=Lactobacillus amylovorus subsp. animalium TaxID=3378536 RepID=A0ABD0C088_LACAM|nr:glycosyltransferase family 2 protein [Lactobacillus amylovorus]GMM15031.1 glycosyltransferase family 2 protein [Lactobacillus amylovorus]
MNKKVDCVVVTYNRLFLLKECLQALLNQTYSLNHIYVVNNNSTDHTSEYLDNIHEENKKIIPVNLKRNLGGAGGFNAGLKNFINNSDSDYIWVMDDDTIPSKSALEKLMSKLSLVSNLGFLCSNVRWKDNTSALMNIPQPERDWNELANKGLIKVKSASFVSILFPRNVIENVGYPITDFFIWGDDVEYTLRITSKKFEGYLVNSSLVEHKIKKNIGTDIILENDVNRIKRYYYANRNYIYTNKNLEGKKQFVKSLISKGIIEPVKILKYAKKHKVFKLKVSVTGTIKGLVFHPTVEQAKK